jgi:hypothetical protein
MIGVSDDVYKLLTEHREAFLKAKVFADNTGHMTPSDTKSWSQILASLLLNVRGIERKKGADLADGSDVKAANSWAAIDVPRFNGVVKAGRILTSTKAEDLKKMPNLIFVLWDETQVGKYDRCRVWVVRTAKDAVFRSVAEKWYKGSKRSSNFQLHPPIGRDDNIVTNKCGNLSLPLLLDVRFINGNWTQKSYNPAVLQSGLCKLVESPRKSFSSAKRAL